VAATPIAFSTDAAQPFDARCLSWQIPDTVGGREATVSILTTEGRRKGVRVLAAPQDLALLRTRPIGETDLMCRDGKWFLYATVDAPQATLTNPVNGFVGVDLGIVNIAATSDGDRLAGAAAQPLPQTPAAVAKAIAGQEDQLRTATVEETPPQRAAVRR
jgi:putative transposase